MTTPPASDNRRNLAQFTRALRAAIYDRRMEEAKTRLRWFIDTDVAIGGVFALEQLHAEGLEGSRGTRALVRALWTGGYLGQAEMLWPHVLEFGQQMRVNHWRNDAPSDTERKSLLDEHGVTELFDELSELAKQASSDDGARRLAKRMTFKAFVVLDAVATRGWERRAKTIGRVLNLQRSASTLAQARSDRRVWAIAQTLSEKRDEPTVTAKTFADGAAIIELSDLISASRSAQPPAVCRFYTHTSDLRLLCQRVPFADALADLRQPTSPSTGGWQIDDEAFALRSDTYFVLRAVFAALRFAAGDAEESSSPGVMTLDQLTEVAGLLEDSLQHGSRRRGHLRQIRDIVKGTAGTEAAVLEMAEHSTNLSFCEAIWTRTAARQAGPLVERVHEAEQFDRLVSESRASIVPLVREEQILYYHGEWQRLSAAIRNLNGLETLVQRARNENTAPTAAAIGQHCGLERWTYGMQPGDQEQVETLLRRLILDDPRDTPSAMEVLNEGLSAPTSEASLWACCCAAWIIGAYSQVHAAIKKWKEQHKVSELPPMLDVMLIASRVLVVGGDLQYMAHRIKGELDRIEQRLVDDEPGHAHFLVVEAWVVAYVVMHCEAEGSAGREAREALCEWGRAAVEQVQAKLRHIRLDDDLGNVALLLLHAEESGRGHEVLHAEDQLQNAATTMVRRYFVLDALVGVDLQKLRAAARSVRSEAHLETARTLHAELTGAAKGPLERYQRDRIRRIEALRAELSEPEAEPSIQTPS